MILRTSSASAALRTKLSAMKSTLRCSANRRSSMSFSDSAGTETATPGRLMPLLLLTLPPTSTSVYDVGAVLTSVTRSRTLPSSIRIGSPALTSPARPLYVVPQISALPSTSRVVIVQRLAAAQLDRAVGERAPAGSSAPAGRRRCRRRARWRRPPRAPAGSASAWSSWVPWLMFSRATSMPAYTSSRIRRSLERGRTQGAHDLRSSHAADPSEALERSNSRSER